MNERLAASGGRSTGGAAPRLTVALTFDHDAISAEVRRGDGPVLISRGEFGPRVGLPRILALLDRERIPATFFVPGHTLATFPESVSAIVAAGHELGCHGWAHEDLAQLRPEDEHDVLVRSRDAIAEAAGQAPRGFRAPYWSLSARTLEWVEELGFAYDSSLMDDDVHLHRVRHGDRHLVNASRLGSAGRLVEVPIAWALDDWPHFEPSPGAVGPLSAPSKVLEIWTEELRYAHAHEPGGVLTLTMHPECIGRGSRLALLERFIGAARTLEGMAFERLDRVVEGWAAANPCRDVPWWPGYGTRAPVRRPPGSSTCHLPVWRVVGSASASATPPSDGYQARIQRLKPPPVRLDLTKTRGAGTCRNAADPHEVTALRPP